MSPKPTLTLRKPPSTASLDEFVHGAEATAPTPLKAVVASFGEVPAAPPAPPMAIAKREGKGERRARGVLERASGRKTRRMTIYVPPDLAKRVVRFCAENEREISDAAAEALSSYLDANS